jgi:LysR family transcriptional regulator of abg operon
MKLSQLRSLIAIAETGSIRAAARRMGVTQPALSKSLQSLEEELSVSLVHRTSKGVNLTPYGQAMLTRGRGISQEMDRLKEEIEQMRGGQEGTISLATSPSPAVLLLPQALARFHREHPAIQVKITESVYPDTLRLLREGLADMALGAHPQTARNAQSEFVVERLYENQLVVTGRSGHPQSGASTLAELLHCEWVLHGPEDGPGSLYAPIFRAHDLRPPAPWVISQSFISTLTLLENSDALSLLPERLIRRLAQQRPLMVLKIRDLMAHSDVSVVVRAQQPLTPVAQKLLQFLRRTAPHSA